MRNMYVILILAFMLMGLGCGNTDGTGVKDVGQTGPAATTCPDPSYTAVSTAADFKEKLQTAENICLTANIELENWKRVLEYKGKLDGNDKKLTIKSFTAGAKGLIGYVGDGVEIKALTIELESDLEFSSKLTGVLAARNSGTIKDVKVIGRGKKVKTSEADGMIGALIGKNEASGKVENCTSEVNVEGVYAVGGLIGENAGTIRTSRHETGAVTGTGGAVGGLVGLNDGTIEGSYASGGVTGSMRTNPDNILNSTGGLVGKNAKGGTIKGSHATGAVETGHLIGGLVGLNEGTIEKSYASGGVTGSMRTNLDNILNSTGGLVGKNAKGGTIKGSHATGAVETGHLIGGLVGLNEGTIEKSYASGSQVKGELIVGGLVGANSNLITRSYASKNVKVDITGKNATGGLVGFNDGGIIQNSYATGTVTGKHIVGGLVGQNRGTIKGSYAKGAVIGDVTETATTLLTGGLVGFNSKDSLIQNSYATGNVTSKHNAVEREHIAGGLVGRNDGTIEKCYSRAGIVTGSGTTVSVGRFVGIMDAGSSITNSFVMEITPPTKDIGDGASTGVEAKATGEIKSTDFSAAGWETSVWKAFEDGQWPKLLWQP